MKIKRVCKFGFWILEFGKWKVVGARECERSLGKVGVGEPVDGHILPLLKLMKRLDYRSSRTIFSQSYLPGIGQPPPTELGVGITNAIEVKRCQGVGMNDVCQR